MVTLEFEVAIFLYLLLTVVGVLVVWFLFTRIEVPKTKSQERELIWQCAICTYIYVDSKHTMLSVCPRCGSYNDRQGGGN